jgi:omega-6 fatty acid desaturase (delta-12 desaturase)
MKSDRKITDATKQFAVEERGRSWFHLITSFAVWTGLLCGTYWGVNIALKVACSLLAGLVSVRLFIIYHDYQHRAILKGSQAAEVIMVFYGLWILSPSTIWRRSHNFHHKHNAKIYGASIGSYPVLTTEDWGKATTGQRLLYRYARHPLTIAFGYWSMFVHGMCYKSLKANFKMHWDSLAALILHLTLVTSCLIFLDVATLFLTLLIPLFVVHSFGAYLFYAQHNYPGVQLRKRQDWSYVFAAIHSSSYMKMSPIMHWFTGNIGYHHVHHLNPRIPFYRLPEAMAAIPSLQNPGTTSLHPKDIWACLRLKLWDLEANRLVDFNGK